MSVVVQCTNCGKKLKMKSPSPGKKLRCPGCKEPFVVQGGGGSAGPKRKKKPAPVDEFEEDFADDFGDEDFGDDGYDESPQPRRAKSGGKKKKKKAAPAKKSKAPLFIGLGLLGLTLAGGLAFMLMSGDGDSDETANVNTDPSTDSDDQPGDSEDPGETGDAQETAATEPPEETAPPNKPLPPEFRWMPADGELVIQINVANLLAGPVGKLLENPMVEAMLNGMGQTAGMTLQDIDNITVGVSGISALKSQQKPPSPGDFNATAVIETQVDIDLSKLAMAIPGAEETSADSGNYLKLPAEQPEMPPMAAWVAEGKTLIIGREADIETQRKRQDPAMQFSPQLLNSQATLNVAFQPVDRAAFFSPPKEVHDRVLTKSQQPMANLIQIWARHGQGAGLSAEVSDSVTFTASMLGPSEAAAGELATALQRFLDATATDSHRPEDGDLPAMVEMLLSEVGADRLKAVRIKPEGAVAQISYVSQEAGQQLNASLQMLPMMAMGAFGGGMGAMGGPLPPQAGRTLAQADHLKSIALAMHNFHEVYGRFPNAASRDEGGKKLLSWRVHILPFIGYEDLYSQFDLDQPWDSPHNESLVAQMPEIYASTDTTVESGKTRILAVEGRKAAFEDQTGHSMADFTDGTSNTVLLVEVAPNRAKTWTAPEDHRFASYKPMDGLANDEGFFRVALADGSVRSISLEADAEQIGAAFTRNNGDKTGDLLLEAGTP